MSERRKRIGVLVSGAIRQYDAVRKRPTGWISSLMERARQATGQVPGFGVRGNVVAADTLIRAICNNASNADYRLFTPPWLNGEVTSWIRASTGNRQRSLVSVESLSEIVRVGLDGYDISAWLSPLLANNDVEGVETSHTIRSYYSSKLYPILTLTHGLSSHKILYDFFFRLVLEGTYPCDTLICTSSASCTAAKAIVEYVTDHFNANYNGQLKYVGRFDKIPLSVDTDLFRPKDKSPIRSRLRIPKDAFLILYLGKLSLVKADLFPFLRVIRKIVDANPTKNIIMLVVGTEDLGYSEQLHLFARELGIDKNLKSRLNVSDDEKADILAMADVFFSPSDTMQESFGITPVEAMACGVPQLVSDWNGYSDTVVHGRTGFLLPTYRCSAAATDLLTTGSITGWHFDHLLLGQSTVVDTSACLKYLQILLDNSELRSQLGIASRARALATYSYSVIVAQYEALAEELTAVASHYSLLRPTTCFSHPDYSRFFGHFASRQFAEDEGSFRLTDLGSKVQSAPGILPDYLRRLSGIGFIDATLAYNILCCFKGDTSRLIEMRDILASAGQGSTSSGRVIRHVMWLAKHSYIQIECRS